MKKMFATCLTLLSLTVFAGDKVTLGGEDDWYPYSGYNSKKQYDGMAVDLIKEAFKTVGVEVEVKILPYARCMEAAKRGDVTGCFDTAKNAQLEPLYSWHKIPVFTGLINYYSDMASPPVTTKELEGKRVGVTNGYEYVPEFDTNTKISRELASSDTDTLKKLSAGRINYGVLYEKPASVLLKENPDLKVKKAGEAGKVDLFVAFTKVHPDGQKYADLLDKGLANIKASGKYAEIEKKWTEMFK